MWMSLPLLLCRFLLAAHSVFTFPALHTGVIWTSRDGIVNRRYQNKRSWKTLFVPHFFPLWIFLSCYSGISETNFDITGLLALGLFIRKTELWWARNTWSLARSIRLPDTCTEMIPDSEVGFSDIYQITDSLFRADVLPCDWREHKRQWGKDFWAMAHGMCTTSNSMWTELTGLAMTALRKLRSDTACPLKSWLTGFPIPTIG